MSDNYGTVGGYKAYWLARDPLGLGTELDDTDNDIMIGELLRASEWVDRKYRLSFPGLKVGLRSQVREWPRTGAWDCYGNTIAADVIPDEITKSVYEAAAREHAAVGSLLTDYRASEAIRSASVDGAVSVTFAGAFGAEDMQISIPAVDRIIAPILTGSGGDYSPLSGSISRV